MLDDSFNKYESGQWAKMVIHKGGIVQMRAHLRADIISENRVFLQSSSSTENIALFRGQFSYLSPCIRHALPVIMEQNGLLNGDQSTKTTIANTNTFYYFYQFEEDLSHGKIWFCYGNNIRDNK